MTSVVDVFLSEFTCPVCIELMESPINQCLVGHAMCNSCFSRMDNCPTCRGPLTTSRSSLMEDFHKDTIFPCKYREEGCKYLGPGELISRHHLQCSYITMSCPFSTITECVWGGCITKMYKHCETAHSLFTRKGGKQTFTIYNFREITRKTVLHHVILTHGEIFQVVIRIYPSGPIRWQLVLIGLEDLMRFRCRIDFGNFDDFTVLNPSKREPNQDILNIPKCYATTSTESVESICQKNKGHFIYTIRIIDRSCEIFLNQSMISNYMQDLL